jgi:D-3-phosphoglycerate dehydrogenase
MERPRVWMERPLRDEDRARLEAAAEVVLSSDPADASGCAAAIVSNQPRVDGAFIDRVGPQLLVVARPGIGVDNIDVPAASERGVLVVNTPDAPTESTAEHAVGLLLALAKRIVEADRWLRGPRDSGVPLGLELRGRTLGLVGLGRIGRRVAEICGLGLRMRVLAHDPYVSPAEAERLGVTLVDGLDALLGEADVVSVHAPSTPETQGLIGERTLARMKRGALLVNASRGALVDEEALLAALRSGHLAGAALDVFRNEPPPPDHPLLALPNVVATPHNAAWTDVGRLASSEGAATQVLQVLAGQRPPWLVDPGAWPGRVAEARLEPRLG